VLLHTVTYLVSADFFLSMLDWGITIFSWGDRRELLLESHARWAVVVTSVKNSSYSEGRDQKDCNSRPSLGKKKISETTS
jgi:hypothetical protein